MVSMMEKKMVASKGHKMAMLMDHSKEPQWEYGMDE
jgi:hypothetical protein